MVVVEVVVLWSVSAAEKIPFMRINYISSVTHDKQCCFDHSMYT